MEVNSDAQGALRWLPAIERKALSAEQVIAERVVTGYAAVMGNVDDGGDVLLPGAFVKTLAERGDRLRYLWMHDASQAPIARIVAIGEVGKAELPADLLARFPQATGALKVSREYLETPRGDEILTAIRRGAVRELSFAYDAVSVGAPAEALALGAKRLLREVRLWEVSDVNWGMNPATMNVKALAAIPQEPGPARTKALAEWFEAMLHLRFTEMADGMFGDGFLTREERIALSGLLGAALDTFNAGMADPALADVRRRERWEKPEPEPQPVSVELMRARIAVLRKQLELAR